MKKQRHYSKAELLQQLNTVARERRMQERTPWTAISIVIGYVLMKELGFKGKRINDVIAKISEYDNTIHSNEKSMEYYKDLLMEKADWTIEWQAYTEADIHAPKGSYSYWILQKQIEPQNAINEQASKYLILFFLAMNELHGFGKDRLEKLSNVFMELLKGYQRDRGLVHQWHRELIEEAGIAFEMPIDPLTQKGGI